MLDYRRATVIGGFHTIVFGDANNEEYHAQLRTNNEILDYLRARDIGGCADRQLASILKNLSDMLAKPGTLEIADHGHVVCHIKPERTNRAPKPWQPIALVRPFIPH